MNRRPSLALRAAALAAAVLSGYGVDAARSGSAAARPVAASPARTHLAVIVNRSNPIDALGRAELRALFLAERTTWGHGRRVTVTLREPGQAERTAALRLIYGMSEADLTRHFLHQTFTGGSSGGPRTLATAEGVKRFVFNVPGAIGVVRLGDVDDTVKVLKINGANPGDAAYPLIVTEPAR